MAGGRIRVCLASRGRKRLHVAMAKPFDIRPPRAPEDMATVAELFRGYAASLPVALDYQDFDSELAALPGKYAAPKGELLIAWGGDGSALGCVGLRPIQADGACEMKRLYLLPPARGLG